MLITNKDINSIKDGSINYSEWISPKEFKGVKYSDSKDPRVVYIFKGMHCDDRYFVIFEDVFDQETGDCIYLTKEELIKRFDIDIDF